MSRLTPTLNRFSVTATRRRYASGTYNSAGDWVPGAYTDTAIKAVIQPAKPEDTQYLVENLRSTEMVNIWSETELRLLKQGASQDPDFVVYGSKVYKLVAVEHFIVPSEYYKALGALQ